MIMAGFSEINGRSLTFAAAPVMKKNLVKYISVLVLLVFAVQLTAPLVPAWQAKAQAIEFADPDSEKESRENDRKLASEELTDAIPQNIDFAIVSPYLSHGKTETLLALPAPNSEVPVPPPDYCC
jgi:hypothetical protein